MKLMDKIRTGNWLSVLLAIFFVVPCAGASTGDFYPSYEAKIVGHIVLPGNPARQMLLQQDGRKEYLYVKQASHPGFTVIDVTKPKKPKVLSHIAQRNLTIIDPTLAITESPTASAGNAQSPGNPAGSSQPPTAPESVRLLNLSNPAKPKTIETFKGVTSIVRDDSRKLVYIANQQGIWILSHQTVLRRHLCSSSDAISSAIPNCD